MTRSPCLAGGASIARVSAEEVIGHSGIAVVWWLFKLQWLQPVSSVGAGSERAPGEASETGGITINLVGLDAEV